MTEKKNKSVDILKSELWFIDVIKRIGRLGKKKAHAYLELKRNRMMTAGNILVFRYSDPKYKEKLKFYDEHPVIMVLEKRNSYNNLFGVNLHYLPLQIRIKFLKYVLKRNKARIHKKQRVVFTYDLAYDFLKRTGYHKTALHSYIPSRIDAMVKVDYPEWKHVASLDSAKFVFKRGYGKSDLGL